MVAPAGRAVLLWAEGMDLTSCCLSLQSPTLLLVLGMAPGASFTPGFSRDGFFAATSAATFGYQRSHLPFLLRVLTLGAVRAQDPASTRRPAALAAEPAIAAVGVVGSMVRCSAGQTAATQHASSNSCGTATDARSLCASRSAERPQLLEPRAPTVFRTQGAAWQHRPVAVTADALDLAFGSSHDLLLPAIGTQGGAGTRGFAAVQAGPSHLEPQYVSAAGLGLLPLAALADLGRSVTVGLTRPGAYRDGTAPTAPSLLRSTRSYFTQPRKQVLRLCRGHTHHRGIGRLLVRALRGVDGRHGRPRTAGSESLPKP